MNNNTTTPIGTSLPLVRTVKRRPLTPLTPEEVANLENPPGAFGLTYEELLGLVRWAQAIKGEAV